MRFADRGVVFGAWLLAIAAAGPGEVVLDWVAPSEVCPPAARVEARIAELIGRPLERDGAMRLRARVEIVRDGAQWRATAIVRTGAGESRRALTAENCEAVGESVAVILAFALDAARDEQPEGARTVEEGKGKGKAPESRSRGGTATKASAAAKRPREAAEVPSAPEPPPPPESTSEPLPVNLPLPLPSSESADAPDPRSPIVPSASLPRPTPRTRVAGQVAAQWAWETAMLPNAGSRLQLGAGAAIGRVTVELGASLRPKQQVLGPASSGADLSALGLHLFACYDAPLGRIAPLSGAERDFAWRFCAGGEVARLSVTAFGTTDGDDGAPLFGALFGELGPRVRLAGNVWGSARLRILATVRRPEVVVDGDNLLFSPAPVGVSGAFGIEMLFGDG